MIDFSTAAKILAALLISLLTYDTINFFWILKDEQSAKKQLEIRQPYEAANPLPETVLTSTDAAKDVEIFAGLTFLIFATGLIGAILLYSIKKRQSCKERDENGTTTLAIRNLVVDQPVIPYYPDEYANGVYDPDSPAILDFPEIRLTIAPRPRTSESKNAHKVPSFNQFRNDVPNDDYDVDGEDETASEKSVSLIDAQLLSNTTDLNPNNLKYDHTVTQTDSTFVCSCNMEQFEERLSALEEALQAKQQVLDKWTKKIEQNEIEMVNLHRQMIVILTKAEFGAPTSELFAKNAGDATPTDFYDPTLYKVPDIIVETKNELEQGDLFRKSLTTLPSDDNWSSIMEEELKEKIKEINNSSQKPSHQMSSLSVNSADPIKIKEKLVKQKEEFKEQTKGIFKQMEDVINSNFSRRSKLNVHSHFIAPYKRIHNADQDKPSNLRSTSRYRVK